MLLACLINSFDENKRVTLSSKIFSSDLSLETKQNLIKILNDINELNGNNILEILQEEQEKRKNR